MIINNFTSSSYNGDYDNGCKWCGGRGIDDNGIKCNHCMGY